MLFWWQAKIRRETRMARKKFSPGPARARARGDGPAFGLPVQQGFTISRNPATILQERQEISERALKKKSMVLKRFQELEKKRHRKKLGDPKSRLLVRRAHRLRALTMPGLNGNRLLNLGSETTVRQMSHRQRPTKNERFAYRRPTVASASEDVFEG